MRTKKSIAERFWPKVAKGADDECWLWTASLVPDGYGQMMIGRNKAGNPEPETAHVISWELAYGPTTPGMFVCHRCDVRRCVNPKHLFLGTPAENQADMARKNRSAYGERVANSKLKAVDIPVIKALRTSGQTQEEVAAQFGIGRKAISDIECGKIWRRAQGLPISP